MEQQGQKTEESTQGEIRQYTMRSFDEETQAGGGAPPTRDATFSLGFHNPEREAPEFDGTDHRAGGPEPDFSAIKFQRENTLLTNAESYAASIREEAELYVRQLREEVEELNKEAESRYEEAFQAKQTATEEAKQLVEDAHAEVERIREEAREEGYNAGMEAGMSQRYDEASPHLESIEAVLGEISQYRKRVAYYTEKDAVRLSMIMARQILQTELKINKNAIARLLAANLAKLEGTGTFQVWVAPDDHAFMVKARPSLERYLGEGQALTMRAKPELKPGEVLIESDREVIDLTLESQLFHMERAINRELSVREGVTQGARTAGQTQRAKGASPARQAQQRAAQPTAGDAMHPPDETPLT